jgi:hypothetical protein
MLACVNEVQHKYIPSMLPGLASAPNNCWLLRAPESRINKFARPSKPAMGLVSETCNPALMISTVKFFSPSPST